MKSYKNLKELNKKIKSLNFQFNEKGELIFHDQKAKKKFQVGKLKNLDQAPKDELEAAKKFYGIK